MEKNKFIPLTVQLNYGRGREATTYVRADTITELTEDVDKKTIVYTSYCDEPFKAKESVDEILAKIGGQLLENGQLLEIVRCKDCKYWRDSDGEYRRGVHAESKCPINRKDVFEGHAYCSYGERRE